MRLLSIASLLPVFLAPAIGQMPPPADSGRVDLAADRLIRNGDLLRGVGHARARIGALAFQADEATWHSGTGELELRGHVQVTLPARADKSLFRYGSGAVVTDKPGAIVTDKPVGLSADRMTVKDGLLQASGNIVGRPEDAQLQSDEMYMDLKTADATLSGNVRATGFATWSRSRPEIPPELLLIK